MIRSYSLLLACLSLGLGCASSSKGSDNPDAGQYDGYYSENGDAAGADGQATGDVATTPTGPQPKPRGSTSTRGGAKRTGKAISLAPTKPPVTGEKPQPTRPTKAEFAVEGVFPTTASVGSLIEVYGSGFPEDAKGVKVFIGGKTLEVVEVTPDRVIAKVGAATSGVVEVGKGTGRIGRGLRAKTQGSFTATPADGAFNQPRTVVGHGLLGKVYEVPADAAEVPNFNDLGDPVALVAVDDLDIPGGEAPAGIAGRSQSFGIHFQGSLNVVEAGEYELCLSAGDGALLFLDQTPVIDNDGAGATRDACETLYIEPGEYGLDLLYYQGADTEGGLSLSWAKDGGAKEAIPATAFFPPEGLYDLAVAVDQAGG